MPQIMNTKEVAEYLRLHEITVCKYAAEGKIPAIRIGRVCRFDKEAVDARIGGGQNNPKGRSCCTRGRSYSAFSSPKMQGKRGKVENPYLLHW